MALADWVQLSVLDQRIWELENLLHWGPRTPRQTRDQTFLLNTLKGMQTRCVKRIWAEYDAAEPDPDHEDL